MWLRQTFSRGTEPVQIAEIDEGQNKSDNDACVNLGLVFVHGLFFSATCFFHSNEDECYSSIHVGKTPSLWVL